jgi:ribosomal protein S18 acetylase RimI-like enzyme
VIAQPVTADRAASALVASMGQMVEGLGGGAFIRKTSDAVLLVTGVAFPTMNGVLTVRTSVSAQDVDELLDDPALRQVVHCVQLRPGCSPQLTQLVARRGMHQEESLPLMAMTAPASALREFAGLDRLTIRVADPAEAGVHARIAAEAFEVPVEFFDAFATPDVLAQPGFRTYLGLVDDVPVTTAIGLRGDDYVGIFDVATPGRYRGRGYGAAVTAMAVLDGFEAGASFAFLQSSEMGYGVYERLGFQTLESWSVWVSVPQSHS